MAVDWRLKQVLEFKGIHNAPQFKAALEETLGIRISRVALEKLLKHKPVCLRLETAQYLCDFLQVPLETFLTVRPEPIIRHSGGIIQPYGKQTKTIDSLIVDPGLFF